MPKLTRRTQLAAKLEAVEGTEQVLAAADGLRVSALSPSPSIEMIARDLLDSDLSGHASLSGKRSADISFDAEAKGSGTAGTVPEWGELMKACGYTETVVAATSVTYNLTSTGVPSMTLGAYMDGMKKTVFGARGNVVFDLEAGNPGNMAFNYQGADFVVADVALLSGIVYDATAPPVVLGVTMTLDGFSFKISKLSLDTGNELSLRDDMSKSSGNFSAVIGARRSSGSFDPELESVASYDIYQKWRDGAEGSLSIVIGTTAGNIMAITAPKVRYTEVSGAERGVFRSLDVNFELNRNVGDDELVIALT